jgi:hypothetical protein
MMAEANESRDPFYRQSAYPQAHGLMSWSPQTFDQVKDIATVVVDTNALLVPYGTGQVSLDEIGRTYRTLVGQGRLVIRGQVVREFASNRVVKLQELHQRLARKQQPSITRGTYPLLEGLDGYSTMSSLEEQLDEIIRRYKDAVDAVLKHVRQWYWNDPVSVLYKGLFNDEVVLDPAFDPAELKDDLSRRVANGIAPGYKDARKDDGGIGDLIIWRTILEVGEKRKTPLLFVSEEKKADWWHQSEGRELYPRFELVDEYRRHSEGQSFHMMTFSAFLKVAGASKATVEAVRKLEHSDAVADFSIASNPAGLWRYGYSRTLGGELNLHTTKVIDIFPGVDGWGSPQVQENLWVMHNGNGATITGKPPTYTIPSDMLHMHPGRGGIYDVIRWTCPQGGRYSIQGLFCGLDFQTHVADTDVHILVNSTTSLFPAIPVLRGAGTQAPIAFDDVRLDAGDTLDFMVGVGPSGSHGADSTGLKATIAQTGS